MNTSENNSSKPNSSDKALKNYIQGILIIILFLICQSLIAQVGVGNTDPKATLDITATNATTPLNTDGILIPRVANFPATNPGTDQDGMLIFYTGATMSGKGFYYWDDMANNWVNVGGAKRINDLIDGKTDPNTFSMYLGLASGTNDDGTTSSNIGIGRNSLNAIINNSNNIGIGNNALEEYVGNTVPGNNVSIGNNSMTNMTTGALNTAIGQGAMENINFNTNSNVAVGAYALRNLGSGTNNTVLGYSAGNSSSGSNNVLLGNSSGSDINGSGNVFIGYRSAANLSTGSNLLYIENSDEINTPLVYGEFDNKIFRINGEIQVNNPSGTGYSLPTIDGTNNQILRTDGSGQINFVDASSVFTDTDNQTLSFSGSILSIQNGNSININGINSDNQTIDDFSFDILTSTLTLDIEDDGIAPQTVDLSSFNPDFDWIEEFTNRGPDNINDNMYTQGRVGIGNMSPQATFDVDYIGSDTKAAIIDFSTFSNAIASVASDISSGLTVNTTAYSANRQLYSGLFTMSGMMLGGSAISSGGVGIFNSVNTSGETKGLGILVEAESNISYGIDLLVTSSPSTTNYGIRNIVSGASSINYGTFSNAIGATTNWAGYFGGAGAGSGNVYIQDNLEVDGSLNYTDGNETAGFVLESDATGNASWVDPTTLFSDEQSIDTFSFNSTTNELTLEIENDGIAAQTVDLSTLGISNTLDQAYDQGGPGTGSTISANAGAVKINGTDGFYVTGTLNSGSTIDTEADGANSKMFFNPNKAAFRAGYVLGNAWSDTNVGIYSVAFGVSSVASGVLSTAFGRSTIASGGLSTAFGRSTIASGDFSTAMGYFTEASGGVSTALGRETTASGDSSIAMGFSTFAPSFAETSIGYYGTTYTPNSTITVDITDRLFSIGNGFNDSNRTNALTIYKSGLMNINDEYNMPLTDGTAGQVMTTDGANNVTWETPTIFTNTDNQTLSLSGTTLSIADGNSVNLSAFTGNTLDQAYDEGGTGAGRIINVDNGAVVIQGNAGGLTATTSAQLILTETGANDFSRLRFTNSAETVNTWSIATRTDDDPTLSRMNFNHTGGTGDLFQLWGDGFVEVNGVLEIDGRLGINVNNPTFAIELPNSGLDGTGRGRANSWQTYSDTRVKKQQNTLTYGLEELLRMTPKSYIQYSSEFVNNSLVLQEDYKDRTIGFIAQELYSIIPEAVSKPTNENTDLWSVDYQKIIPVAVKAIQELHKTVESLKVENTILKAKLNKLESLEARLSALESKTEISLATEVASEKE